MAWCASTACVSRPRKIWTAWRSRRCRYASWPRIRAARLWVATSDSGLFRIEKGTVARFSQRDGLPAGNVACLFPGQGGDLWACTAGGLAQIKDGKIHLLGNTPAPAGGSIAAAAQRNDGTIWMGGDGPELSIWTGAQFTSYSLHSLPRYARIQAMLSGSDNTLWIGTTAGLIRLEDGREQRFTKSDGLANDSVLSLAEGRNAIDLDRHGRRFQPLAQWRDRKFSPQERFVAKHRRSIV